MRSTAMRFASRLGHALTLVTFAWGCKSAPTALPATTEDPAATDNSAPDPDPVPPADDRVLPQDETQERAYIILDGPVQWPVSLKDAVAMSSYVVSGTIGAIGEPFVERLDPVYEPCAFFLYDVHPAGFTPDGVVSLTPDDPADVPTGWVHNPADITEITFTRGPVDIVNEDLKPHPKYWVSKMFLDKLRADPTELVEGTQVIAFLGRTAVPGYQVDKAAHQAAYDIMWLLTVSGTTVDASKIEKGDFANAGNYVPLQDLAEKLAELVAEKKAFVVSVKDKQTAEDEAEDSGLPAPDAQAQPSSEAPPSGKE